MLNKEEISKLVCPRCDIQIGNREWTLNPKGCFVHNDNCNGLHQNYDRR